MKILIAAVLSISYVIGVAAQTPVPVSKEPRHHLKFENQYTRVFDVVVPPGDTTLFHTHSNDYVFVSIGDANLKAEVMGNPAGDLILKNGEVRFTKATITHRITNQSKEPFRNITIEVLKSGGGENGPDTQEQISGHTIVLDNDRVRIERLQLEPGMSTNLHEHRLAGLGVFVSGGTIEVEAPGQPPQRVDLKPGDFRWHEAKTTHKLKNVGATRFEAVDIEWK